MRGRARRVLVLGIFAVVAASCITPPTPATPRAVIDAVPTVGTAPLAVSFSAAGSTPGAGATVTSWTWTFGDGSTGSGQSVSHTFAAGAFTTRLVVKDSTGASASATTQILVAADRPPVAALSAIPATGDAPLSVTFSSDGSAAPDGSIASYAWTFGDGASSTQQNPTHLYATAGSFAATLTVTDSNGLVDVATTAVQVSPHQDPVAAGSADTTSGLAPLSVSFSSTGSHAVDGALASSAWSFGDGSSATSANPSHTYQTAGNYTATLTVTDTFGSTDSTSIPIAALPPVAPTAVANATPAAGHPPLNVAFSSVGSTAPDGSITAYLWDFGDGTSVDTTANPAHLYTAAGNYAATLTITDNLGLTGSTTTAVDVSPVPNQPPVAVAGATSPTTGDAPLPVALSSAGSIDPDGTIATYLWSFGDGTTVDSTANPTHTYSAAGTYTATLTVTDNAGATDSAAVLVTVAPHQNPIASAAATPLSGKAPLAVGFSSLGSHALDGTIANYSWTFGDSSPRDTSANPTHTYAAGNYTATLTITDSSGATDSMSVSIAAIANVIPTAVAAATPDNGYAPLAVALSSAGSIDPDGTVVGYSWSFGDGSPPDSTANPTHTYTTAGAFTTTLTVTDDSGAIGTATAAVHTVADTSPPTWPSGATLTTPGVGATFVSLAWPAATDNIGVTGYQLTVDHGTPTALPSSTLSTNATGLTTGAAHTFSIAAVDAAGNVAPLSSTATTASTRHAATALGVGEEEGCAVVSGVPSCWGDSVPVGTGFDSLTPYPQSTVTNAVAVAGGFWHSCALLATGSVRCWGYNGYGELGNGTTTSAYTPVAVTGITNATAITAMSWGTCALLATGAVDCWGSNGYGELGHGTTANSSTPLAVTGITNAIAIDSGADTTCAVLSTGGVDCWGQNFYGQLGNGTTSGSTTPVPVTGITNATAVGVGLSTTCAVLVGGSVRCWGHNERGELGNGTTTNSSTPVAVNGVSGVVAVTPGDEHTCALLSSGGVSCWGDNRYGEVGNGANTSAIVTTPTAVAMAGPVRSIGTGTGTSCALLIEGAVQCWGWNGHGQLGNGTSSWSTTPSTVSQFTNPTDVSVGSATCGVIASGSVECFGDNFYGQAGGVVVGDASITPVPAAGITNAVSVSAGNVGSCALLSDATVSCWGSLGYNGATPTPIPGLSGVVSLSVGDSTACAVLSGGTVQCWGSNYAGELGNGTQDDSQTPVTVTGVSGATAVSVGYDFACALLGGGSVQCWGGVDGVGLGLLGNGSTTGSLTAVTVTGVGGATAISAGADHTCVIVPGGAVKCWGNDSGGQLGNGQANSSTVTPVSVVGLSGVVSLGAGIDYSCAVLGAGNISCWGQNDEGVFGVAPLTSSLTPVSVPGVSGVIRLASGYGQGQECAIETGPVVKCWGSGSYGQNDNPTAISSVPANSAAL